MCVFAGCEGGLGGRKAAAAPRLFGLGAAGELLYPAVDVSARSQRNFIMLPEPTNTGVAGREGASYFIRHWRGEFSTPRSLWLNAVAVSILAFLSLILIEFVLAKQFQRQPGLAVILIVSAFLIGICVNLWSFIGLHRSARSHKGETPWLMLARVLTVIWLGYVSLAWIWYSQTLILSYYNCTTGRDFGPTAAFFNLSPCRVDFYPKHGFVVHRLPKSGDAFFRDPFD